ncbi:hypothetical protein ABT247_31120 [Kitasatospora sp. NPDC001539]|uniref:hypothetical protein n=1 Tax=Kitasatospora sp. NPDC001539 TaxID=3154384 RepID=UPI003329FE6C
MAVVLVFWLARELFDRAGAPALPEVLSPLVTAAVFAVAAVLAAPRPLLWRPRIVLLAVLALCWPLSAVLGGHRTDERLREALADVGVPLYAPDVTGYHLGTPLTSKPGRWFGYTLLPDRPGVDAGDPGHWAVRVTVQPMERTFRPPHCDSLDLGSTVSGDGCEQVAPNTWRRVNPYVLFYFVRRGDHLIVMSADARNTPEADLRALASSLAERDPDYFVR